MFFVFSNTADQVYFRPVMSFQQQPVMHDGNAFAGSRLPYVNYGQSAQLGRNQQVLKDSELATLCAQMSQQYIAPQLPQMSQEGLCPSHGNKSLRTDS